MHLEGPEGSGYVHHLLALTIQSIHKSCSQFVDPKKTRRQVTRRPVNSGWTPTLHGVEQRPVATGYGGLRQEVWFNQQKLSLPKKLRFYQQKHIFFTVKMNQTGDLYIRSPDTSCWNRSLWQAEAIFPWLSWRSPAQNRHLAAQPTPSCYSPRRISLIKQGFNSSSLKADRRAPQTIAKLTYNLVDQDLCGIYL
jgi:hypothetical protein